MPGVLAVVVLVAALAACAPQQPHDDLYYIRDDQHEITDPSRDHATATGVGCAGAVARARLKARRVAEYNLRSLTGAARYRLAFDRVREWERTGEVCVEMIARAIPY